MWKKHSNCLQRKTLATGIKWEPQPGNLWAFTFSSCPEITPASRKSILIQWPRLNQGNCSRQKQAPPAPPPPLTPRTSHSSRKLHFPYTSFYPNNSPLAARVLLNGGGGSPIFPGPDTHLEQLNCSWWPVCIIREAPRDNQQSLALSLSYVK